MKLNQGAFAQALAITMGTVYVVCAAGVAFLPAFSRAVAVSWFHGIDLSQIWTGAPRGNFILGLITAVVGSWLLGWLLAGLYNKAQK